MTGNMSRRKGAGAERDVVAWLRANGFPNAERRLGGRDDDTGDITGIGPGLVIEVKNKQAFEPAKWTTQLLGELENAKADTGFILAKPRGKPDPDDWYGILPGRILIGLLRDAGWGDPR